MEYVPFGDYFGLSNVAWNKDLLAVLGSIESPPSVFDPLDMIRSDAREDFDNNGVSVELDELDYYQSQLRSSSQDHTALSNSQEKTVLAEYLEMKQQRRRHACGKKMKKVCVFCKNNGEQMSVYQSHILKDVDGRISCPILRKYICPLCGVSGDDAHTIRYCPKNDSGSSLGLLLKSNRLSSGKAKQIKRNVKY